MKVVLQFLLIFVEIIDNQRKKIRLFLLKRKLFNNFTAVFPGNNLQTDLNQPGKMVKF